MSDGVTNRQAARSSCDELLKDHREVRRLVTALDAEACTPTAASSAWVSAIRELLTSLRETLLPHFALEEEGALYREVPIEFPRLAERCRGLANEHQAITGRLGSLLAQATALAEGGEGDAGELSAEIRLLAATIRSHEAQENEIMMTAYWDDLGSGD